MPEAKANLTKAIRNQLRDEIKRTGVTAMMLLNGDAAAHEGLTPRDVNRWIGGLSKSARQSDLDYVFRAWAALPDRSSTSNAKRGRPHNTPALGRIEITEAMVKLLRSEFARTWSDYNSVITVATDIPDGLTPRVIRSWLKREVRAKPEHWEFVIAQLAEKADDPRHANRTVRRATE